MTLTVVPCRDRAPQQAAVLQQKQNILVWTHFCPDPGGRGCTLYSGGHRPAPAPWELEVRAAQAAGRAGLPEECKLFGRRRLRFGLSTSTAALSAAQPPWLEPSFPACSRPRARLPLPAPPSLPLPPSYVPYSPVHHLPGRKHPAGADKLHVYQKPL